MYKQDNQDNQVSDCIKNNYFVKSNTLGLVSYSRQVNNAPENQYTLPCSIPVYITSSVVKVLCLHFSYCCCYCIASVLILVLVINC